MLTTLENTGSVCSVIKSFLNVVINGQFSGALAVNANFPKGYFSDQLSFLFT